MGKAKTWAPNSWGRDVDGFGLQSVALIAVVIEQYHCAAAHQRPKVLERCALRQGAIQIDMQKRDLLHGEAGQDFGHDARHDVGVRPFSEVGGDAGEVLHVGAPRFGFAR